MQPYIHILGFYASMASITSTSTVSPILERRLAPLGNAPEPTQLGVRQDYQNMTKGLDETVSKDLRWEVSSDGYSLDIYDYSEDRPGLLSGDYLKNLVQDCRIFTNTQIAKFAKDERNNTDWPQRKFEYQSWDLEAQEMHWIDLLPSTQTYAWQKPYAFSVTEVDVFVKILEIWTRKLSNDPRKGVQSKLILVLRDTKTNIVLAQGHLGWTRVSSASQLGQRVEDNLVEVI